MNVKWKEVQRPQAGDDSKCWEEANANHDEVNWTDDDHIMMILVDNDDNADDDQEKSNANHDEVNPLMMIMMILLW